MWELKCIKIQTGWCRLKPEILLQLMAKPFPKYILHVFWAVHVFVQTLNMNIMETIWLTLWCFSSKKKQIRSMLLLRPRVTPVIFIRMKVIKKKKKKSSISSKLRLNWLVYCRSAHRLISQVKYYLQISNATTSLLTSDTEVTLWQQIQESHFLDCRSVNGYADTAKVWSSDYAVSWDEAPWGPTKRKENVTNVSPNEHLDRRSFEHCQRPSESNNELYCQKILYDLAQIT